MVLPPSSDSSWLAQGSRSEPSNELWLLAVLALLGMRGRPRTAPRERGSAGCSPVPAAGCSAAASPTAPPALLLPLLRMDEAGGARCAAPRRIQPAASFSGELRREQGGVGALLSGANRQKMTRPPVAQREAKKQQVVSPRIVWARWI